MARGRVDAAGSASKADEEAVRAAGSSLLRADLEARRNTLLEWSKQMQAKRDQIVAAQKDVDDLLSAEHIDGFIEAQGLSTDTCNAKMLEAKRSLDGLLHQVQELSMEIDGENTIIEGNTRVINEALERKRNAEDKHAQAYEACKKTFDEAKQGEPLKILAEIEELKNFADPEVRSRVAHDINYSDSVKALADKFRTAAQVDTLSQGVDAEDAAEIVAEAADAAPEASQTPK